MHEKEHFEGAGFSWPKKSDFHISDNLRLVFLEAKNDLRILLRLGKLVTKYDFKIVLWV